jgi:hypothetical protein
MSKTDKHALSKKIFCWTKSINFWLESLEFWSRHCIVFLCCGRIFYSSKIYFKWSNREAKDPLTGVNYNFANKPNFLKKTLVGYMKIKSKRDENETID